MRGFNPCKIPAPGQNPGAINAIIQLKSETMTNPELHYHQGTLILQHWPKDETPPHFFEWDPRSSQWRALAMHYDQIKRILKQDHPGFQDKAASFSSCSLTWKLDFTLHPYQQKAVDAWVSAGKQGTIVLPTGSGKTIAALHAMAITQTHTLIVCPTLDLMHQWYDRITDAFGMEIGMLGGGYHEIRPVTVTTYDSAYRHIDRYGDRFGLLVFDEVHHLPAVSFRQIPELSLAPYRLGLTATYRRADSRHIDLNHLIGRIVFKCEIKDMTGAFLSDYEIRRIRIPLTEAEKTVYTQSSMTYSKYIRDHGIRFYGEGWQRFVRQSGYDPEARQAMLARQEMRNIVFGAEKKLAAMESLLKQHAGDRIIIFTQDNDLVYKISIIYLIPALTHQTDKTERKQILRAFREGRYRYLVTSKVLNEGVDVPEANVAVILSGSASTTEHLQRLGRILRKKTGKKALLYEIVAEATKETLISYRRRQSDAYR